MNVEPESDPNEEILLGNFRFTKVEDILFAFEVDGEYVYNLLCKRIDEQPYTKPNEYTAIREVFSTVILRCYDKNAIEALDLVNFLTFEDSDVGLWKGVKANWALALREVLPKNLDENKR